MTSDRAIATLEALRERSSLQEIRSAARQELAYLGVDAETPVRERLRAEVAAALALDLRPADHPIARWLLEQESAAHEARGVGASEALYTLVAAVARFAHPEDAFLLWRAREATDDTRAGVDVEQFARLGVAEARATLMARSQQTDPDAESAARAVQWLDEAASDGAFADLPGYFLWADERFGLRVSGPT